MQNEEPDFTKSKGQRYGCDVDILHKIIKESVYGIEHYRDGFFWRNG